MTMSFFGKKKNIHNGPPAPPRRTDDNAHLGWPQDEFDDEEGDMYEVPPCLPVGKVPQTQVEEENVYLERTSNPAPPQRQAAPPQRQAAPPQRQAAPPQRQAAPPQRQAAPPQRPPPRPGKPLPAIQKPQQRAEDLFYDNKTKKPPEINRKGKPGRKEPPPPGRSAPAPGPADIIEEDVYLDPNEEQEDNDDVYLEPAAFSPDPRVMKPSPPKTALVPPPMQMMKPSVPRLQSNSYLPSLNELKTAPSVEARRASYPIRPLPPNTGVKPPLPANLKEAKHSLLNPSMADTKPVASSGGTRATKQSGNEGKEWFAGNCNRKSAEDLLLRVNKDGAFLIRHSSAQGARQPFTLAVLYQQKVYNVPIRFLEDTHGYALGKEGKKNVEIFGTLDEMISHHKNNQLLLIDSKSQAKHTTSLTYPARP